MLEKKRWMMKELRHSGVIIRVSTCYKEEKAWGCGEWQLILRAVLKAVGKILSRPGVVLKHYGPF